MIYYFGWIVLVTLSLWASLVAFVWALRNGQFSQQGRARYLPLSEETYSGPAGNPGKLSREVYALLLVLAIGFTAFVSALALSLYHYTK